MSLYSSQFFITLAFFINFQVLMSWVSYTLGTNDTTVVVSCIMCSNDATYSCKLPVLMWYGAVDLTYSIVWSIMYNYLLNVIMYYFHVCILYKYDLSIKILYINTVDIPIICCLPTLYHIVSMVIPTYHFHGNPYISLPW